MKSKKPSSSPFLLSSNRSVTGQAALSFVFLVSGIIILVGITLAILLVSFLNSSSGLRASNVALSVASAGADDALVQLARNKDFSSLPYIVPVGSYAANVAVTQNLPVGGQVTVLSSATVLGRKSDLQMVVSIDQTTGQVSVVSRKQLSS